MISIPAIDLLDNQCVRLSQGDYAHVSVYSKDPLDVAKQFEDSGITHLHLVDLEGAKTKEIAHHKIIEKIVVNTNLQVDVGGGVKSEESFKKLIDFGAHQVNVGSMAVENHELFVYLGGYYGWEKMILSADVKALEVVTHGWLKTSGLNVLDFISGFVKQGLQYATVTDVSKDGMLSGVNQELYRNILKSLPSLKLIASGGVSRINDLYSLREDGLYGCIVGKAFYEEKISLTDLIAYQDAL